ncbi:fimbrial protein [Pseudomonas sp.]|uniref:fimbrial protein n=1 Tax=Pseudomonas sp. TaxID=306 RepID=UPI003BAF270C
MNLGNVSIKDLHTNMDAGRRSPADFKFDIHCSPGTSVKIAFDASSGSGSHATTGALKLIPGTDAAAGVAIALLRNNGSLINLNSSAGEEIKTELSESGTYPIHDPHLPQSRDQVYRGISGEQFHGSSAS